MKVALCLLALLAGTTQATISLLQVRASSSTNQTRQAVCPGDTRGDGRCNHDDTHRVCAKIGDAGTTFWEFTGQTSWCGSSGDYGGAKGSDIRCPADNPTWCICKWATARWIAGEGCNDNVEFDCAATDVCDLKASYTDGSVD